MTKHKSFTTTTTTKLYGNKQSSRPWSTITRGWDAPRSACRDWSAKSRKTCANFYDLSVKISSSCHIIRVTQDSMAILWLWGFKFRDKKLPWNAHNSGLWQYQGGYGGFKSAPIKCFCMIFFKYLGTIEMGSEMVIFAYYQYIEVGWVRKVRKPAYVIFEWSLT